MKTKTLRLPEKYRVKTTTRDLAKRATPEPFKDSPAWKKVEKRCKPCKRVLFVLPDFGLRWISRGGELVRDPQPWCNECRIKKSAYYKQRALAKARYPQL